MAAELKVVTLNRDVQDIPRALRALADEVEQGKFPVCHNIAWVMDLGDGAVACGLMGGCAEAGPTGYLLFGKAMRSLEEGA